ncbi:MAG: lactate utilization protein [bacterium]
MKEQKDWSKDEMLEGRVARTLRALEKNEFQTSFIPDGAGAKDLVLQSVRPGMRVGVGGSRTVRDLGLPEALQAKGAVLLDHWDESLTCVVDKGMPWGTKGASPFDVRKAQLTCDVFLASVNAVTEKGELVSRDGIGNRVGATTFGPSKVFLLVGVQKIVEDLHAAFRRLREVAGPLRARSLNLDLPCVKGGVCVDCDRPERLCRATLILHKRPLLSDITVILIGQSIGY